MAANFAGTAGTSTAPPTTTTSAAAAAANNKKKDSKRSKLIGDLTDIPARWKWFINPRETVFDWAKSEAHNEKRLQRKRAKKAKAAKRKALKALKEQEAQVAQQSQDQSASVDVYGPAATTGEEGSTVANDGARTVVQRLEEEARARAAAALGPSGNTNTNANTNTNNPGSTSEAVFETEAFAEAAVAPRLVTQYGRVWVRPQTMYGEEGSVAATGDGATSNVDNDDDDDASSDYDNGPGVVASPPPGCSCGVAAPPNSVADSGYGRMEAPVVFEEADGTSSPVQLVSLSLVSETESPSHPNSQVATVNVRCRCRLPTAGAVGGFDGAVEGPTTRCRVSSRCESSGADDAGSFVTCLSRP